jgi:hypothetical protein
LVSLVIDLTMGRDTFFRWIVLFWGLKVTYPGRMQWLSPFRHPERSERSVVSLSSAAEAEEENCRSLASLGMTKRRKPLLEDGGYQGTR